MKLSSIRLHNFRPYHGDQTLDLTPAENNTLIVIYGENTMGKTVWRDLGAGSSA